MLDPESPREHTTSIPELPEDNILPDEDGIIDPNTEEANENVIAVIMTQQAKSIARSHRLTLTQEPDDASDGELDDLLLGAHLGISEAQSETPSRKPEIRERIELKPRLSRSTNIPNETPAPFMAMQLIDPHGARVNAIVRDIWLRIISPLPNRDYCALVGTCRYFRQLLQQYRTLRIAASIDRNNLFQSMLKVIRNDDVDMLQVMCSRGDVADVNIAAVHALHNRSIKCIYFLQTMHHDIGNAFVEILKLDNPDLFKILRQRGAEITDHDIGQIIEYDALAIFSYLMHLIDPRMLLSVELDRTPASMTQMMLHAADHCSYRIIGYLHSLGVAYVPRPDITATIDNQLPVTDKPIEALIHPEEIPTDEAMIGISPELEDIEEPEIEVPKPRHLTRMSHQYAIFGDIRALRLIAQNETRIIETLQLYHKPDSGLPRLNETQLQNILLDTGFRTFKTLLDLGYTDIVRLFTRVERKYRLENTAHEHLGDAMDVFSPKIDPERELYIVEVLKMPLSEEIVTLCITDTALFLRLHELGMRANGDHLILSIMQDSWVYDNMRQYHEASKLRLDALKLAHSLGYDRSDVPIDIPNLDICILHYLVNCGYTISDQARINARDWEHTEIESNELESLYQSGFHWNHSVIKQCLDKDRVNMIAATVNLGIWDARTNIMLWVIASRAQACFEYLVHKETLPYAAQAFQYRKDPLSGIAHRTNNLSDDFPIDWICLAYYMPWPWFVTWIKSRASITLLEKIKTNAREWSRTQGLDRLIPPGWHDIRNFIARRLIVDGRPKITRDLLEGKDVSLVLFED